MTLAIAILAAGGATRFGGGKLDAELLGKPLGRHALDAALALAVPAIVVGEKIPDFALDAEAANEAVLLANPRAAEGLGTSVALAAGHAGKNGAGGLLLLAADMPLVTPDMLAALAAEPGQPAAVRHPDGHPGIPAFFPRSWFARLEALEGGRGAGSLLRGAPVRLIDAAPGQLHDIDTREALARLAATLGD